MNKNFTEAYESVCKENVRLRADLEAEEMALKKVVAEVNELTRRLADDSNKKSMNLCEKKTFSFATTSKNCSRLIREL